MNSLRQQIDKFPTKFLPLVVIVAGILLASLFVMFSSQAPKVEPEKIAVLVTAYKIQESEEWVTVKGAGTVKSSRELEVRPQVAGQVVEIHQALQVGGRIPLGMTLLKIDPRDYQIARETQKAALARADVELQLEQANQVVAAREWELLSDEIKTTSLSKKLLLRKPQLREKRAAHQAAKSQLARAELDLSRTEIKSPFPALVVEESVEVGEYVSSQQMIARIIATDEFQIEARIPREALRWFSFDDNGTPTDNTPVDIIQSIKNGPQINRQGEIIRLIGDVDPNGRMARILVRIPDPLKSSKDRAPLLLGSYAKVVLKGKKVSGGFLIPRRGLREGSKVWIFDKNKLLDIRKVEVVFGTEDSVYIRGKLTSGELIVTNPLSTALQGTPLELSTIENTKTRE